MAASNSWLALLKSTNDIINLVHLENKAHKS